MRDCLRLFGMGLGLAGMFAGSAAGQPAEVPAEQVLEQASPVGIEALGHVETTGNGPVPVILIPGSACDWTVFREFMVAHRNQYTMHAVTLAGYGGTAAPEGDFGQWTDVAWLNHAAQGVAALVDLATDEGGPRAIIVGHSLGVHLAFRASCDRPEKVAGVVAIDGYHTAPAAGKVSAPPARRFVFARGVENTYKRMSDERETEFRRERAMGLATDPDDGERIAEMASVVSRDVRERYILEFMYADLAECAASVSVPVKVLVALDPERDDADHAQKLELFGMVYESVPGVELIEVEGRHFLQDDAPGAISEAVAELASET
ncbi:MAG: alpha/beta hydrolase [Planctomycetota bacterium]